MTLNEPGVRTSNAKSARQPVDQQSRPGSCIDCGNATGGIRCKPCNGRHARELSLVALAVADRELLRQVDEEHISAPRLATRLGISRTRAYVKIREARQRETLRTQGGAPMAG